MKILISLLFFVSLNVSAEKIADFKLKTFDGSKTIQLSDVVREQKVFLNFWATWCPPCKKEIPELEELKKKYPDVLFIGINAGDKAKKVKKFVKKNKFTYLILDDKNREYSKSIGVLNLPQSIVVGKNLEILYRHELPPRSL